MISTIKVHINLNIIVNPIFYIYSVCIKKNGTLRNKKQGINNLLLLFLINFYDVLFLFAQKVIKTDNSLLHHTTFMEYHNII